MQSKESALGKKPACGKAARPPSLTNRPVWQLLLRDFDLESSNAMQALHCCAQTLLARGADGGSQNVLRCVLFVIEPPDGRAASASLLQTQADKDEEASLTTISTSPNKSALAPASFNILLIFENDGRLKQSVKTTVNALLTPKSSGADAQLARSAPLVKPSLQPWSFPQVLQLIAAPHVRVHAEWNPALPRRDVTHYIARRAKEGALFDRESTAVMAGVGLDLLGPRPKHSLPPQPQPPKRLKGPEPTNPPPDDAPPAAPAEPAGTSDHAPPTEAAGPSGSSSVEGGGAAASALQELLQFDGTLTKAVAADRATALLSAFHAQSEELCRTRLQLKFYEDRDRLEAMVRPCFKKLFLL